VLTDSQRVLGEHLAARGEGEAAEAGAYPGGGEPQALTGQINSRQDVIKVLDKACEYFSRHEPSSPVPLLLQRAKRLVAKDFMEIMRDLAPDGVTQAQTITGAETEE
jgi:type VI secretion system protein ImpA